MKEHPEICGESIFAFPSFGERYLCSLLQTPLAKQLHPEPTPSEVRIADLFYEWEKITSCQIIRSLVWATKSAFTADKDPTRLRVFSQDLSAALNRRGYLRSEDVEEWRRIFDEVVGEK